MYEWLTTDKILLSFSSLFNIAASNSISDLDWRFSKITDLKYPLISIFELQKLNIVSSEMGSSHEWWVKKDLEEVMAHFEEITYDSPGGIYINCKECHPK